MDSGYFDEEILKTIETLGCKNFIKENAYGTLVSKVLSEWYFHKDYEGRVTAELFIKLVKWHGNRRIIVSRVLLESDETDQMTLLD